MRTLLWLLPGMLSVGAAQAQANATTATAVLQEMGRAAAVVFAGQVETVTRVDPAGYVDVRFQVEHGVRGTADGRVYVLREWGGLWAGGAERYRPGQRLLVLLLGRGPGGMSSPVGGQDGAMPLFTDADGVERVDLRWVRARAVRGTNDAAAGSAGQNLSGQVHADPLDTDWPGPVLPMTAGGPAAGSAEPALASVLALLGATGGQ